MMPQTVSPVGRGADTPVVPAAGEVIGTSDLRVWHLPAALRLARQLARAGAAAPAAAANGAVEPSSPARPTLAERFVLLRGDWVFDDAIVRALVQSSEPVALYCDGQCVAAVSRAAQRAAAAQLLAAGRSHGVRQVSVDELTGSYNSMLRKREPPFLMPLTAQNLAAVEAQIFQAAYKGVTDAVTLYVWPRPARAAAHICARLGVTPNMVTALSFVFVIAAMWAFWNGWFFSGLAAAWFMTFLDTLDGKLARVTLTSSRFGNFFDHSIDLIHPPFWWWAWIVGLNPAGKPLPHASFALAVILIGYLLQRLEEGLFILWFKMDMHVWQRFDSRFRLVTARRNPNLLLLTGATLAGRPDLGILAVAIWVAVCLLVHAVRLAQAGLARRHGALHSWLAG